MILQLTTNRFKNGRPSPSKIIAWTMCVFQRIVSAFIVSFLNHQQCSLILNRYHQFFLSLPFFTIPNHYQRLLLILRAVLECVLQVYCNYHFKHFPMPNPPYISCVFLSLSIQQQWEKLFYSSEWVRVYLAFFFLLKCFVGDFCSKIFGSCSE